MRRVANVDSHPLISQVIQPVVEREVQDRHRIHTVIPTKRKLWNRLDTSSISFAKPKSPTDTTHEAPIIHKSTKHEPVSMDQFLGQGGKLDSTTTHDRAGLLHEGDCSRKVDGVGEDLARSLHLSG